MEVDLEYAQRGDYNKYKTPLLKEGDNFTLLQDIKKSNISGTKQLKKGSYTITTVRKSFFPMYDNDYIYDFKSIRKNSSYEYAYSFIAIDKSIEVGLIKIN